MKLVTLTMVDDGGRVVTMPADLTETAEERRRGLSGRTVVERPMLFREGAGRGGTIHYTMRSMLVPLDILAVDDRGRVVDAALASPGDEMIYRGPYGGRPIHWIIELPAGWRFERGLGPGARIRSIRVAGQHVPLASYP